MTFVTWDIPSFNEQERRLLFQEIARKILSYRMEAPGKPTFVPFSTLFFPLENPKVTTFGFDLVFWAIFPSCFYATLI